MDLFSNTPTLPLTLPQADGYSWQWLPDCHGFLISVPHGELLLIEQFFPAEISDRALNFLQAREPSAAVDCGYTNINWQQAYITMFGKRSALPRLTAWYGDADHHYTYSGIHCHPTPWNAGLSYMKQRVEAVAGCAFNSVLLNMYRGGDDHLHWHADDETELGLNPTIASLSFGQSRDFLLRRNSDHSQKLCVPLGHGSLLLMRGALQHHWQHSVPKRKRSEGTRCNLTFRYIFPR